MSHTSENELRDIYKTTKTIAVVGASTDSAKPAHRIPAYLQRHGYRILPVSPRGGELFGERVYESLIDIDVDVDAVDVFRPGEEAPRIARDAVAIGAKVLWLQTGIVSDDAAEIARAGGLTIVMDRCMGETHAELGLGPDPYA